MSSEEECLYPNDEKDDSVPPVYSNTGITPQGSSNVKSSSNLERILDNSMRDLMVVNTCKQGLIITRMDGEKFTLEPRETVIIQIPNEHTVISVRDTDNFQLPTSRTIYKKVICLEIQSLVYFNNGIPTNKPSGFRFDLTYKDMGGVCCIC